MTVLFVNGYDSRRMTFSKEQLVVRTLTAFAALNIAQLEAHLTPARRSGYFLTRKDKFMQRICIRIDNSGKTKKLVVTQGC